MSFGCRTGLVESAENAPQLLLRFCVKQGKGATARNFSTTSALSDKFKSKARFIWFMKSKKMSFDELIEKLREWRKDPEFRKAIRDFVKATTS